MRLFGPNKKLIEAGIREMEGPWKQMMEAKDEWRKAVALTFASPDGGSKFIDDFLQRANTEMNGISDWMRGVRDMHEATFVLSQYTDMSGWAWIVIAMGGLADAMAAQRKVISDFIEAMRTEGNTRLEQIAEQLAKAPTLTNEQAQALDKFRDFYDQALAADKRAREAGPYE
jgi:hypothetical protein